MPVTRPIPNSGSSRLVSPDADCAADRTPARSSSPMPRTQETLLLQGSARSCPNCRKRCLNELEEWSKKLPPDVRTGVIWTSFTVFFHEKLSAAPSCPGDCQRLVTLRALGNFFFYSPYDRRIV